MKKITKKMWLKIFIFSLLGIIAFCLSAIAFGVFPANELPLSFIGACLGAIISAIITQMLLTGQTEHEEIKTCNVRVYEKKSKIFQEYIEDLWVILEDQKITAKQYEKLIKYFSIRLMTYLKKEENQKSIEEYLESIGEVVYHTKEAKTYEILKKDVIGIINVLSDELELGGQIDLVVYNKLEKPLYPALFKQAILNELNQFLMETKELHEGKICMEDELIGYTEYGGEYICFDFRKFKGCKLIIGSFSQYCPHGGPWLTLFIEKSIHGVDSFRQNIYEEEGEDYSELSKYLVPISNEEKEEEDGWLLLTSPEGNPEELGDFNAEDWLFLDNHEAIEPYRNDYQKIARILGKRAKYWFEHGQIWDRENNNRIPLLDFLREYAVNKQGT